MVKKNTRSSHAFQEWWNRDHHSRAFRLRQGARFKKRAAQEGNGAERSRVHKWATLEADEQVSRCKSGWERERRARWGNAPLGPKPAAVTELLPARSRHAWLYLLPFSRKERAHEDISLRASASFVMHLARQQQHCTACIQLRHWIRYLQHLLIDNWKTRFATN